MLGHLRTDGLMLYINLELGFCGLFNQLHQVRRIGTDLLGIFLNVLDFLPNIINHTEILSPRPQSSKKVLCMKGNITWIPFPLRNRLPKQPVHNGIVGVHSGYLPCIPYFIPWIHVFHFLI